MKICTRKKENACKKERLVHMEQIIDKNEVQNLYIIRAKEAKRRFFSKSSFCRNKRVKFGLQHCQGYENMGRD